MFQGWSRRNNPQAKVLTTVLAGSIEVLPLHAGLCRGGPNTSLATRGINNGDVKFK